MTTAVRTWSPQQQAFIDWAKNGSGSCVLEAVAGAGKTTTLIEAARQLPGKVAILAYNKKIADEIKGKVQVYPHIQAGTVHSFGFNAYRKAFDKVRKPDSFKVSNILVERIVPQGYPYVGAVAKLISYAKNRGLGVIGSISNRAEWHAIAEHFDVFGSLDKDQPRWGKRNHIPSEAEEERDEAEVEARNELIIEYAIKGLLASNNETNVIDFDDMVYLPLIHRVPFFRFDTVIIDEAQDTNPSRRALARALLKKGGRLIAVGDRHQAIYGFTGADNDSLDQIARDFSAVRLPLTITYRCPKAVVEFAKQWVNHIEAHETAPQGSVSSQKLEDFLKRTDLNGDTAVLCRLNAPLVQLAFSLIRNRIPCKVEGREIGASLKKLIVKWKRIKTLGALADKLDDYLDKETTKYLAKKQEAKVAQIEDTVETIKVIIAQCQAEGKHNVSDAEAYIDSLFGDNVTGIVVLSSIHKSKGREWKRVFWWDRRATCPNKWARQEWQKDQEVNLQYVAATRAQEELIDLHP